MNIPAFASERFVITIETTDGRNKLFQILFQKKNGSLFVSFPYYKDTTGFLTLATLRAKAEYPSSLSLIDGGKVTGHKVKYSHHPDGSVHFSQDGKILTKVRKKSVSLAESDGHIFTIQLKGLRDFNTLKKNELKQLLSNKKTILNFRFEGDPPEGFKFIGHWYKKSSLLKRVSTFGSNPQFVCEKPDNTKTFGMLIRNPFLNVNEECYLLLSCEAIPILDKDRYSTLTFIGGFDQKEILRNNDVDTRFLALAYPATESYQDMVKKIGTVDYVKPIVGIT